MGGGRSPNCLLKYVLSSVRPCRHPNHVFSFELTITYFLLLCGLLLVREYISSVYEGGQWVDKPLCMFFSGGTFKD